MPFFPTSLKGVTVFEPAVYNDERGHFFESYNEKQFNAAGIDAKFVQDNQSFSKHGVLRGLHYQLAPFAQAKLVRVLHGEIFDAAVDIRKGSPNYGKWTGVILSAANKKQMFIPRGFAHGFLVLSDYAEVFYKCDNLYSPAHNAGIIYNDKTININWPIDQEEIILSEKDAVNPALDNAENNFVY
ncbi:MAG TPA: dTDP-4-dehydrorhamnose 3,5-epimerase [Candidatus Wallbacteria bacterium]|nr:dTDP-4-dehydrorhamnose 3,5-epimerase [Candidatus Wallbacteria bacterium]